MATGDPGHLSPQPRVKAQKKSVPSPASGAPPRATSSRPSVTTEMLLASGSDEEGAGGIQDNWQVPGGSERRVAGAGQWGPAPLSQLCVHDNYRHNPFHNFRHCFCVAQMMYSMICLCGLQVGVRSGVRPPPPRESAHPPVPPGAGGSCPTRPVARGLCLAPVTCLPPTLPSL